MTSWTHSDVVILLWEVGVVAVCAAVALVLGLRK